MAACGSASEILLIFPGVPEVASRCVSVTKGRDANDLLSFEASAAGIEALRRKTPVAAVTELDRWFVEQVLAQEGALTRFIKRNWNDAAEIADLRQEIYARAYDGARKAIPAYARAYLFAVARNLLIDRTRRAKVIAIDAVADLAALNVATDLPGPERHLQSRQELQLLRQALETLPPRCKEVVILRKIERLPQRDVARRLSITEDTVERQVGKGMRILAEAVFGHVIRVRRRPRGFGTGKAQL